MSQGKWVWVTFPYESRVKPHLLHPQVAEARLQHLKTKYGAVPDRQQLVTDGWLDFGGMVRQDDPVVWVTFPDGRRLGTWEHQAQGWLELLMVHVPERIGRREWLREARWPGVLLFISLDDRKRACRAFKACASLEKEQQHKKEMVAALAEAQPALKAAFAEAPELRRRMERTR